MKKTILFIIVFFFGCMFIQAFAQDVSKALLKKETNVNILKHQITVLNDPKLSAEEKEQMIAAGQDNPSKIPEGLNDPKMDPSEIASSESYGEANAKALPIVERKEVKPEAVSPSHIAVSNVTQPESAKKGTHLNCQKGPGEQPDAIQAAKKVNLMESKGSDTQPPGNKPHDN